MKGQTWASGSASEMPNAKPKEKLVTYRRNRIDPVPVPDRATRSVEALGASQGLFAKHLLHGRVSQATFPNNVLRI